jgi:hypothetical protein
MKTNLIIYSALILILLSCSNKKREPGVPPFTPSIAQLLAFESRMDQLITRFNLTGVSAALVNNREIIWQKNWDSGNEGTTTDSPDSIGTLTNIFVPVIVLQLMEKEKLDLNDPVVKYLQDYNGKASIKHLLSHTSEGTPGTSFNYNQQEFSKLADVIREASGESLQELISDNIIDALELQHTSFSTNSNGTDEMISTLADLAAFSRAIDDTLFFEDKDLSKYLFRPMYLVTGERTPCSIGWFVQYYRHIKLCWNFGSGNNFSSLLIKEPNQQLTLILLARSEQMNKPFDLPKGDCLNSPIAMSFLRTFFFNADSLPTIDSQAEYDTIKAKLIATKSTDSRDLYIQELLSYIKFYQSNGNSSAYNQLLKLYADVYPNEIAFNYKIKTPLAEIGNVYDSYFIRRDFSLKEKTDIRIFAVGEKVSGITYGDPWQDDNIEVYFDMNNEKTAGFNNQGDDRQYRIQYNRQEFTGMNIPTEGVVFQQDDLSSSSYTVEFQFPWKTLGFVKPKNGLKIGFDLIIGDNDGTEQRKGSKAWHTGQNIAYQNTSVYGNLKLLNTGKGGVNDSIVFAGFAAQKPRIDGKRDAVWNTAAPYPLEKTIEGVIMNDQDLSASFRALWDKTNLYLLIDVTDNMKYSRPNTMYADYGWIERKAEKDTVWMMTQEKYKPAGGDTRNIKIDRQITLEPGNYLLRYISNGSHSYDHWIAERPETSLYGIVVYEEK